MSQDDDLQKYLSNQPRQSPKPKRAVTNLTFSHDQWQASRRWYNRSLPPVQEWPRWIWPTLGTATSVLMFLVFSPYDAWTGSRGGEVSRENLANFPPPSPYQEVSTDGRSPIVITNGSPEKMRIGIKGTDQSYAYEVPPCRDCTYTEDESLAEKFCDRGPQQTLHLPPGNYEVTVGFGGTIRYFRSGWLISPNWEYRQCIYGGINW